ncbi:hypothetical protein CsSME_00004884 [Camellia sinensis var. sinensis]
MLLSYTFKRYMIMFLKKNLEEKSTCIHAHIDFKYFVSYKSTQLIGQLYLFFLVWNIDDTRGNIKIGAWEEGIFKRIWGQPKTLFLRVWIKCWSTTTGGDAKTLDSRWRLLLA